MGCGCKMRGGRRRSSQRRRSSSKKQRGGMIRDLTRVIPWDYNTTPAVPTSPEWQPKPPASGFEIGTRGGSRKRRSSRRRSSQKRRH